MAPNILELNSDITANIAGVAEIFKSRGLQYPSSDRDIPPDIRQDADVAKLRASAIKSCKQMIACLQDPREVLSSASPAEFAFIRAVCHFNIATSFPVNRATISYSELSTACGLPEPQLRRIVRGAMSTNVFYEPEPGQIAHTPTSSFLATNSLLRQWFTVWTTEIQPALGRAVEAMIKWPSSEEPNQTGYSIANNAEDDAFTYMAKFPGRMKRFADAMSIVGVGPGMSPSHLLKGFAWSTIGGGTIVDVGGAHGEGTIPILRKYDSFKTVVQDLSEVVATGPEKLPEDMKTRIDFMVHDFFTEQPVKDADVYLLRWILHDWSDKYAIKILRALIPALKKGSRVIIMEAIMPDPQEVPSADQKVIRSMDMSMQALLNGKEREAQDWRALIEEADQRFDVRQLKPLPDSNLGLIELVWSP